jgi:ribosomal protein S18 acetylase RimI-like enzyme
MEIKELSRDNYHLIKEMWAKLNRLHGELSNNFKNHFESFTFEKRMQPLFEKKHLSVFIATDTTEHVVYCIVSAENGKGEIDSIYIEPEFRKQGIGSAFVKKATDWFDANGCDSISIFVADGNDSVLEFYNAFGFQKRGIILQKC